MRETKIINSQWDFTKQGECVTLDLPHTWNGKDGQDGGNDYFRGTCTYEKLSAETGNQQRGFYG